MVENPGRTTDGFPLWSVIVIVATVASAAAGAAWQVGRSRIQDEVDQLRRSADLGLPETLEAMRSLSEILGKQLENREELETIPTLRAENEELRDEVESTRRELEQAKTRLSMFDGDTFVVPEGKTRSIVPGRLALGVTNVIGDLCVVQLGNKSSTLSPGEPIEVTEAGVSYRVILLEIELSSCTFSLGKADFS